MPPGTPKNSPTSNRSAGEGRGVSREPESGGQQVFGPERGRRATVERREPGDKPSDVPETEVQPYGQYRRNDPAGCAKPTAAGGPGRKLGIALQALRYRPRAEVQKAEFRERPYEPHLIERGAPVRQKTQQEVRRHPGEHARVDPRAVFRALPHDVQKVSSRGS